LKEDTSSGIAHIMELLEKERKLNEGLKMIRRISFKEKRSQSKELTICEVKNHECLNVKLTLGRQKQSSNNKSKRSKLGHGIALD
jgi:hypothetical protein